MYILDINLFLDIWFTIIFSHSIGCPLTPLIVCFAVQKHIRFDAIPLVYFFFCFLGGGIL